MEEDPGIRKIYIQLRQFSLSQQAHRAAGVLESRESLQRSMRTYNCHSSQQPKSTTANTVKAVSDNLEDLERTSTETISELVNWDRQRETEDGRPAGTRQ
jgi:hypothetical protein